MLNLFQHLFTKNNFFIIEILKHLPATLSLARRAGVRDDKIKQSMNKTHESNLNKFLQTLEKGAVLDWSKKLVKEFPQAEVYLVGGAVRDALLGVKDNKDFDFVVRHVPMKKLEEFLGRLGWVEKLGRNFGVLKFKPKKFINDNNFEPLDIALPRTEFSFNTGGYKDFKVKFDKKLALKEDLLRRDFTINAVAVLIANKDGILDFSRMTDKIIDPFCGLDDLKNKTIRAVGKPAERFGEDYSRILRAVRLSCQLNFKIEKKTFIAIKKLTPRLNDKNKKGDWIAPRETIAKELLRAFYYQPVSALDLCDQLGIFKILMPEILKMKKCPQPKNFHSEGDVWQHTKLALNKINSPQFRIFEKKVEKLLVISDKQPGKDFIKQRLELVFAIIFHDLGKPYTIETPAKDKVERIRFYEHDNVGADLAKNICERLTFSAPEKYGISPDNVSWLVRKHMMLIHGHPSEFRPTTIEKYFFSENYSGLNLIKLAYLDSLATIPQTGKLEFDLIGALLKRIKSMRALLKEKQRLNALPKPLIDGTEIMHLLKISSGKRVGELKEKLREAQLLGKIKNKKEAQKYLIISNKQQETSDNN